MKEGRPVSCQSLSVAGWRITLFMRVAYYTKLSPLLRAHAIRQIDPKFNSIFVDVVMKGFDP